MESLMDDEFVEVKVKNSSEDALRRWRSLCWLVKNPKCRFHFTANLNKRSKAQAFCRNNQAIERRRAGLNQTIETPQDEASAGEAELDQEVGSLIPLPTVSVKPRPSPPIQQSNSNFLDTPKKTSLISSVAVLIAITPTNASRDFFGFLM